MNKRLTFIASALLLGVPSTVVADDHEPAATKHDNVSITWVSPEEFSDVRPTNQSRTKFREQTLAQLEDYFVKLAKDLPQGQSLQVKVTDLDLAGQVWPSSFVGLGHGAEDVRVIKRIDIPRIAFSYTLTENGDIIKQADVKLKDMAFMDRAMRGHDSDRLRYEKRMLADWFEQEFSPQTARN